MACTAPPITKQDDRIGEEEDRHGMQPGVEACTYGAILIRSPVPSLTRPLWVARFSLKSLSAQPKPTDRSTPHHTTPHHAGPVRQKEIGGNLTTATSCIGGALEHSHTRHAHAHAHAGSERTNGRNERWPDDRGGADRCGVVSLWCAKAKGKKGALPNDMHTSMHIRMYAHPQAALSLPVPRNRSISRTNYGTPLLSRWNGEGGTEGRREGGNKGRV